MSAGVHVCGLLLHMIDLVQKDSLVEARIRGLHHPGRLWDQPEDLLSRYRHWQVGPQKTHPARYLRRRGRIPLRPPLVEQLGK